MKYFIALLFCIICGMQFAFAETLPPKGYYDVKPEEYPVLFEYLNNHANQLFEEFNPGILEAYHWGPSASYTIYKDGTIEKSYFTSRQIEKVVKQTSIAPFPKELETDRIKVSLILFKDKESQITIDFNEIFGLVEITIYKDHDKNRWFKKKHSINIPKAKKS